MYAHVHVDIMYTRRRRLTLFLYTVKLSESDSCSTHRIFVDPWLGDRQIRSAPIPGKSLQGIQRRLLDGGWGGFMVCPFLCDVLPGKLLQFAMEAMAQVV